MSEALKKKMSRRKGLRTSYSNAVGNAKKVQLSRVNEEIFELLEADDVEGDFLESESETCELDEILAELRLCFAVTEGATPVAASMLPQTQKL